MTTKGESPAAAWKAREPDSLNNGNEHSTVTPLRRDEECEVVGRSYALVPPGRYTLGFRHHETFLAFRGTPKLVLWFAIVDPGEHFETAIPKFYNVKELKAKPRRGGAFRVGSHSNLVLDLCTLFPDRVGRLDRISLDLFRHHAIVADVGTVGANSAQRALPAPLTYSVVRQFVETFKP